MKVYSLLEFFKNSTYLILLLLFLNLGLGFYAPALSYSLLCYILVIALFPLVLRTFSVFKYKIANFKPITKKLCLFGLPVFVTVIGAKFISYIDTLILTYFGTLKEVGIYNVIMPSAMIFLFFGRSISAAIFPMVSELWAKKDKKRLFDGLRLLNRYSFVIIIPPALTVIAFSSLFIKFFFGKEYVGGALALQILMVGMLFFVVAGINHHIISAIGKPKTVTKIILFAALVNLIANLLLIPRFGINGAAVATTLSYLIALIMSTYKLTRFIEVKFPKIIWLKLIIAGIIFVSVINYTKNLLVFNPWIELIIAATLASFAYLIVIYLLKIADIKEIKHYLGLLR